MELTVSGHRMLNVSGSPHYIVEWLEVIPNGPQEGDVQVGFVRVACASLEEVRAELRREWKNVYLTSFCILVRNEAGLYDFDKRHEWKDTEMEEFIERAKNEPLKIPDLYCVPESALHPIEDLPEFSYLKRRREETPESSDTADKAVQLSLDEGTSGAVDLG